MASHPLEYSSVPGINPGVGSTGARERIDARPDAFGASIGRAMETLGGAIEKASDVGFQLATTQEQIDGQTHAAELHSWQSEQTSKAQAEFLTLKGKAAIDALPDFDKRIREIHDEAKGQGGNPYTTRLVDAQGRRLVDVTASSAVRHAAAERKTWEARTAADSAQSYGSRAVLLASQSPAPEISGDVTVQTALGNSDNEIRNLFQGQGYDGPAIDAEVQKNRGRNVKAIVEQIASDASPDGASPGSVKRAFDFYKSQEEKIDAGSRVAIQNYLKGPLNQIAGRKIAEETMGRVPGGGAPVEIAKRFVGADEVGQREVLSTFIGNVGGKTVDPATTAWCAAFVNGVLHKAGLQGSDSLAARSFLNVGQKVEGKPQEGDVVVLWRGDPNGQQGHVGFYVGEGSTPGSVRILAGNEGNKVAYAEYPASRVLGVRRVSRDDIGATPMIDGTAGKPIVDRGTAMLRIMDDPALRDRPQVQSAALAHLNKVYQAYELKGSQNRASFDVSVKNSTAEALATGKVANPLSYEQFIQNYGGTDGEAQWAEYQANVQLGADVHTTAGLASADLAALREKYTPQPGEHFIDQQKRLAILDKAIAANAQAREDDPASFLIARTDFGKEAYAQFTAQMADKNASPEMRTAYADMYANKMRQEQARLGIAPDKVRIVPQAYVDQLSAKLNNPALNGGSLAIVQGLEAEAKLWGSHWPEVYRQMAKNVQPVVRVIGSGVKSDAAQVLADLSAVSLPDILKDQNTERAGQIKKDVLDAFKPLAGSMGGQDGAISVFNDFREQAEKLAAKYVIGGMTSSDAATKAFDDLVGFKYTFQDGYRVPKEPGIDAAQVMAGAAAVKTLIGEGKGYQPAAARDTLGGLSPDYLARETARAYARDGKWVTSPDEKGLMLTYNDRAVRMPDGGPLIVPWRELQDLGRPAIEKDDQRFNRYFRGGRFG